MKSPRTSHRIRRPKLGIDLLEQRITPYAVSGNLWALAALPVILVATRVDLHVPRLRWVFYAYYPVHLVAIWLIRIPMSKAGYLFF